MKNEIKALLAFCCVATLGCAARAQEILWTVATQTGFQYTDCARWFGDLDHDGYEDLLTSGLDHTQLYSPRLLRILSGADGSVLAEMPTPLGEAQGVGDFDGDGNPDVAFGRGCAGSVWPAACLEIWSLRPPRLLLQIPELLPGSFGAWGAGNLDCTGDGLSDYITVHGTGDLSVFDHFGTLYYTIPALSFGFRISDVEAVGDIDGDGADDFVVGANELVSGVQRGSVTLVSGRTGIPLRIHWGPQPYDILNRIVMAAGDMDGDGVIDYAGGNIDGFSGLVMAWSGATGALIREFRDQVGLLSGAYIAGRDVDLDGRPDIIDIAGAYPVAPYLYGRLRTLSSRDGQDLVQLSNTPLAAFFGTSWADLGVQPGNPYPVIGLMDWPYSTALGYWLRIRAIRLSPAGTRLVGEGCASSGAAPTIGVRRVAPVAPSSVDTSRLVLGSAPGNALAVCVIAPIATASAGGVTVPAALDPLGLMGCDLLVPPALIAFRITGSVGMDRGYADVALPVPLVPTGGTSYAAQWVVLDPVTLARASTVRYEFRVQ